jgi:hypothetical protein
MANQAARKYGHIEETASALTDEKRRRGLAQLMAAIWDRHNAPADDTGQDAGETKRKDYLAEIW